MHPEHTAHTRTQVAFGVGKFEPDADGARLRINRPVDTVYYRA
jgi:hypothetical protein